MVNLLIISPFILFGLVIIIFSIIAYREYLLKITKYTVDKSKLQNTYLKILNHSNFYKLEDDLDLELVKTSDDIDENYLIVPPELLNYSFLLNPIRLAIMKILNESYKYASADLRKILDISWGKYTPHIKALEKKGYIVSEDEFIDDTPRKVLILQDGGRQHFVALESILKGIIRN